MVPLSASDQIIRSLNTDTENGLGISINCKSWCSYEKNNITKPIMRHGLRQNIVKTCNPNLQNMLNDIVGLITISSCTPQILKKTKPFLTT